jgi:hypothetical protein
MHAKRSIEMFSAGCPACEEMVTLVNQLACPSCDITVLDMQDSKAASAQRAWGSARCPWSSSTAPSPIAVPAWARISGHYGERD